MFKINLLIYGLSVIVLQTSIQFANGRPSAPDPSPDEHFLKYFYFPTSEASIEIIFNDTDSLLASGLKPATKTIILLDGFTSNVTSFMNVETKNAFSGLPAVNLILVDWSFYNGNLFPIHEIIDIILAYANAMNNIPKAGENLAHFFNFLRIHKQIEFSDITVVSHSLGCHAAGSAGRATKNLYDSQISRIVGLDPALQISEMETSLRLKIGDASVVEIYHTARETIGDIFPATGDITIYPNGGDNQPCKEDGSPVTGGCSSHSYSWKLYNYALLNYTLKACPCKGAACHCKDCSFECGDDAIHIGPLIPEDARGSYHIKTGYLW